MRANNQHRKNKIQLRLSEHSFSSEHDYLFTKMRIQAESNASIAVSFTRLMTEVKKEHSNFSAQKYTELQYETLTIDVAWTQ